MTYRALLSAALAAGGIALPQTAAASPQDSTQAIAASTNAASETLPQWGVQLDAGLVDFLGLNAIYRPLPFLRLHGGPLFNGAGLGVRGGVSLVPFQFLVTPSLTLEAGHYFPGDVTGWTGGLGLDPRFDTMMRQFSYSFYTGQLGLEVGAPNRFAVYLRGGLTYLDTELKGSGQALQQAVGDETLEVQDFKLRGTFPSFKLGVLFYFG